MNARSIRVRGVVQGVGFRPFVFRLATANALSGWVLNAEEGVEMHLEGEPEALDAFVDSLNHAAPPAARISSIDIAEAQPSGFSDFSILDSHRTKSPSVRISPDLPVCEDCLRELFQPGDARYRYPYINCTNCGPRYSIVLALPYDRGNTTMKDWPLDALCSAQYHDPLDRRFHAQPVACAACGPTYLLTGGDHKTTGYAAIETTAALLREGRIVAIKGLGGYHLASDARNTAAVKALRERKFRKEKPFALMARNLDIARTLVELSPEAESQIASIARPIVLAPAKAEFESVAPDTSELGVMLPYTPVHHLLFDAGAPDVLVMTSANRSNEPIAYEDHEALATLGGIADAFLIGQRPIARRVDDSVVRAGTPGPVVLRRARGFAPGAVACLPIDRPVLAVGADLKNSITLVVKGQAFVSQYIGDLDHYEAFQSFEETIRDLMKMYGVRWDNLLVVHDGHPEYASTVHALSLPAQTIRAVQHHRAHIASVLAEREAWHTRVIGVSFDGTGYGDDGSIWGGEIFLGSVAAGFDRIAHLRSALLPGGDAAARNPVQAAAGFVDQLGSLPDLAAAPFLFPKRFDDARMLLRKGVRTFATSSMGRLFDTAAALVGFTRPITFEGQAAMWLEHLAAQHAGPADAYPFPLAGEDLDFRPLLRSLVADRLEGKALSAIARSFHRAVAHGLSGAATTLAGIHGTSTVVLSGGVFQNELLLRDTSELLQSAGCEVWTNHSVPPNDGGISLGQAALAAFGRFQFNA